jgi:hypothetical protein
VDEHLPGVNLGDSQGQIRSQGTVIGVEYAAMRPRHHITARLWHHRKLVKRRLGVQSHDTEVTPVWLGYQDVVLQIVDTTNLADHGRDDLGLTVRF